MISVFKESACASVLWIRESVFKESEQVESVQTESVEEVVVEFEQEAKVTKAAINNTFFILYKYIVFKFFVLLAGLEPARDLRPKGF